MLKSKLYSAKESLLHYILTRVLFSSYPHLFFDQAGIQVLHHEKLYCCPLQQQIVDNLKLLIDLPDGFCNIMVLILLLQFQRGMLSTVILALISQFTVTYAADSYTTHNAAIKVIAIRADHHQTSMLRWIIVALLA